MSYLQIGTKLCYMKKLLIFIFLIILSSCSEEEPTTYYSSFRIKNSTAHTFKLTIDNSTTANVYFDKELVANESTNYFEFAKHNGEYWGFISFGDQMKIVFLDNNKGYFCNGSSEGLTYCFSSKSSPIGIYNPNDFIFEKKEGNIEYYTYEITQEDYENAHVLP